MSRFAVATCSGAAATVGPYALSHLQKYRPQASAKSGSASGPISTGWWGNFTEGEAIALMHKAFDLGITLFDAADTYGNGLSEELIAKAFPNQRDEIVIATKVGYDFVTHGEARGRGQREIPQDFSPEAIVRATEAALKRLKTDRIDLLQLHNIRMEQIYDDALWTTLEKLKASGKDPLLRHRARAGHRLALRRRKLHSRTRHHERAAYLQHARTTSRPRHAGCGDRSRQGHDVSGPRDAFFRNARRANTRRRRRFRLTTIAAIVRAVGCSTA